MTSIALKKNSFFSLIVSATPSVIGLITIPLLIKNLGLERFSFLSIVWALIGYFGIFDLGLSRSLNKRTASLYSQKNYEKLNNDLSAGLFVVCLLGLILAFLLNYFGHLIIAHYQMEPSFTPEALASVGVISLSVPVMMIIASIKGILEGFHDFTTANKIQLANGLSNFLIPALISFQKTEIQFILLSLLIFRVGLLAYGFFYLSKKIQLEWPRKVDSSLFTEGGWLTLSSIASPIMIYFDRLLLGSVVTLKNLVFYTAPVDLIGRMWIFPQAVTRVTFPTFSYFEKDKEKILHAYSDSMNMMILVCLFPTLLIAFFSHQILHLWIDLDMAQNGYEILKILTLGVFFNCLTWIPYSLLQATDGLVFSSIVVVIEVPIYLFLLWILSTKFGLIGAASAWSLRMILDSLIINTYIWFQKVHLRPQVVRAFKYSVLFFILVFAEAFTGGLEFLVITHAVIVILALSLLTWIYIKNPMTKEFYSKFKLLIRSST
jgi:O-antigen/teichoic acid export membrane protein